MVQKDNFSKENKVEINTKWFPIGYDMIEKLRSGEMNWKELTSKVPEIDKYFSKVSAERAKIVDVSDDLNDIKVAFYKWRK